MRFNLTAQFLHQKLYPSNSQSTDRMLAGRFSVVFVVVVDSIFFFSHRHQWNILSQILGLSHECNHNVTFIPFDAIERKKNMWKCQFLAYFINEPNTKKNIKHNKQTSKTHIFPVASYVCAAHDVKFYLNLAMEWQKQHDDKQCQRFTVLLIH